jgi:hypothetical protein
VEHSGEVFVYKSTAEESKEIPINLENYTDSRLLPYTLIMAPGLLETVSQAVPILPSKSLSSKPLQPSGALDKYESFDVTPVIGTEYPGLKVVDLLNDENADDLIRDLAIKSNPKRTQQKFTF